MRNKTELLVLYHNSLIVCTHFSFIESSVTTTTNIGNINHTEPSVVVVWYLDNKINVKQNKEPFYYS